MYTIIGGDGKEYGPVTTDQIRIWISAGRANLETRAKALGSDEWKQLGDFAAFAPGGSASAPDSSDGTPTTFPAPLPAPQLEVTACYERGWNLLKANFLALVGVSLLVIFLSAGASVLVRAATGTLNVNAGSLLVSSPLLFWRYLGIVILEGFLVSRPLGIGFYYYILKRARGETTSLSDIFAGFSRAYLPLAAAGFLAGLLTMLGCFVFLLPGIYLAVAYSLTGLIIVDRKVGAWTAMEMSRRAITAHWWTMLAIFLIAFLLMLAGLMALLVGIFIAIPLVDCVLIYAYLDLFPAAAASKTPSVSSAGPS